MHVFILPRLFHCCCMYGLPRNTQIMILELTKASTWAILYHNPWSQTMKDGPFPWSNLMVQLPWYDFLKRRFTKPLHHSVGVNQMWTKRNDHAPKSEYTFNFNVCPKRAVLKNWSLTILLSCLLFIFSSPKKHHWIFIITIFLCHGPLSFFTTTPFWTVPLEKPLDNIWV